MTGVLAVVAAVGGIAGGLVSVVCAVVASRYALTARRDLRRAQAAAQQKRLRLCPHENLIGSQSWWECCGAAEFAERPHGTL